MGGVHLPIGVVTLSTYILDIREIWWPGSCAPKKNIDFALFKQKKKRQFLHEKSKITQLFCLNSGKSWHFLCKNRPIGGSDRIVFSVCAVVNWLYTVGQGGRGGHFGGHFPVKTVVNWVIFGSFSCQNSGKWVILGVRGGQKGGVRDRRFLRTAKKPLEFPYEKWCFLRFPGVPPGKKLIFGPKLIIFDPFLGVFDPPFLAFHRGILIKRGSQGGQKWGSPGGTPQSGGVGGSIWGSFSCQNSGNLGHF